MLKAPGAKRLKLKYDEMPSNIALRFNLRRYIRVPGKDGAVTGGTPLPPDTTDRPTGAGVITSGMAGMNVGTTGVASARTHGQGLTLVPNSAQLEIFHPPYNPNKRMRVSWSCSN